MSSSSILSGGWSPLAPEAGGPGAVRGHDLPRAGKDRHCRVNSVDESKGGPVNVWTISQADLQQLKGGGGQPFAHFVDYLIHAQAARCGLPQSEIATQLRVNVSDGGVDTTIHQPMPKHEGDQTGWFAVPTCWQFKAVDAKDVDDKKKKKLKNELQKEIHKPYARKLIEEGYGYRLCLLGDLSPVKLKDWESQLRNEARLVNPGAPAPHVIHGGHLVTWAERFPAIVARLRNLSGILHWDAWAANRRAVTRNYVPNREWDSIRFQIHEHIRFDHPCVAA